MSKIPGKGATLRLQTNSTYEVVAHGVEIVMFSGSNQAINTTILESTAQMKEGTSVPDFGDATWTGFIDPTSTTQNLVLAAFSAGHTSNAWWVQFADGDTSAASFSGAVTGYAPTGATVDSFVQTQITIAINGGVTFTT